MSLAKCAICRRPVAPEYQPFCSKRCADVDLQRWLVGTYALPVADDEEDGGRLGDSDPDAEA